MQKARLARRLAGNHDWLEFESTVDCIPTLGGLGNVDRYRSERFFDGKPFEAMGIRIFQPAREVWHIRWVDDRQFTLDPPVIGRFSRL